MDNWVFQLFYPIISSILFLLNKEVKISTPGSEHISSHWFSQIVLCSEFPNREFPTAFKVPKYHEHFI